MKLTTIIENLVYKRGLVAEHGLSIHIGDGNTSILFDTGQGAGFIHNAKLLGINISEVDYLVISHGHYDHIGGLDYFLKANSKAKIILKGEALQPKYHQHTFIGAELTGTLPADRLIQINSTMQLTDNISIICEIGNYFPEDNHKEGFFINAGNGLVEDTFTDELFLAIEKEQKVHILSSCSHNGITNIVETARQYYQLPVSSVTGGFHTKNASPLIIRHIIDYFNKNGIEKIGVCHCTGVENYLMFQQNSKADIYYNCTGTQITI